MTRAFICLNIVDPGEGEAILRDIGAVYLIPELELRKFKAREVYLPTRDPHHLDVNFSFRSPLPCQSLEFNICDANQDLFALIDKGERLPDGGVLSFSRIINWKDAPFNEPILRTPQLLSGWKFGSSFYKPFLVRFPVSKASPNEKYLVLKIFTSGELKHPLLGDPRTYYYFCSAQLLPEAPLSIFKDYLENWNSSSVNLEDLSNRASVTTEKGQSITVALKPKAGGILKVILRTK